MNSREASDDDARVESILIQSLQKRLQVCLSDGYPHIELAAEVTGISVRTLQRRLNQAGISYSGLVQQARFDAAVSMMTEPGTSLTVVAYRLGYADPSNFSRAFRQKAGVSPREFRRQTPPPPHLIVP